MFNTPFGINFTLIGTILPVLHPSEYKPSTNAVYFPTPMTTIKLSDRTHDIIFVLYKPLWTVSLVSWLNVIKDFLNNFYHCMKPLKLMMKPPTYCMKLIQIKFRFTVF